MNVLTKSRQEFENEEDDEFSLHSKLTEKHIAALKERFDRSPGHRLEKTAFRKALYEVAQISLDDKDFNILFLKLDMSRTFTDVIWLDFLTHMVLGFAGRDIDKYSNKLEPPIKRNPKEFKSHHRINVNRILFVPEVHTDRSTNYLYGMYITCSKDGCINYWSIDLEKTRSVQSTSPELHVQATWIIDMITLPDVGVICTASSERDLRFYDTTAKKFELRVIITSLDNMVTALFYKFYQDVNRHSKFIFGDSDGKVRMIKIDSKDRGPFKSTPKCPVTWVTFEQFSKNDGIEYMRLSEIPTFHTDWVRQVAFFENIHCIISISTCSKQSMLIHNPKGKDSYYSFQVPKGFSCFVTPEEKAIVATGGPDCLIRVWNPFVPTKALATFSGHHAGIVSLIMQDDHQIIISLDTDKCIKVWDVLENCCLQSYYGLPTTLGERTPLCTFYNPTSRQLFIASMTIVVIQIYPLLNPEYTDGISHSKEVSVVLYNNLFRVIITCGYDSFIIVWNPWLGKRIKFIRNAHTIRVQGETIPIEITAGAFDPSNQFLITGASDGTLKIWNFNTGTCQRNLAIESEVFAIVWIKFRILVMGENRGVTEFADSDDVGSTSFKNWTKRHQEDVLCAATHLPQTLVTASHCGEIIFWRLETGQPYGMYNVLNPKERIQIVHKRRKEAARGFLTKTSFVVRKKRSVFVPPGIALSTAIVQKRQFKDPSARMSMSAGGVSINALVFLGSRKSLPNIGTLLVALENGIIQLWSHHPGGGFIDYFKAVHSLRDYVISMCTDKQNNYVFTGHMAGYIKTWHMINFGVPKEKFVHICKPKLRLIFPFLWHDTILGRAKRVHKREVPMLLNCFRAHLKPVTGLVYADDNEMVISCSSDKSVRMWTLGGRYLGTLGTFKPWTRLIPNVPADPNREFELPADIKRAASFTTFKVLTGGNATRRLTKKQQQHQYEHISLETSRVYGHQVDMNSVLGKHFKIPARATQHFDVTLESYLNQMPIYTNMIVPQPVVLKRPVTPELIINIRKQQEKLSAKKNSKDLEHLH